MQYLIAADAVLLLHVAFVTFVVAGGLLVLRRPRWIWVHVPAVIWGVLVEFDDLRCPLTPIEYWLLERGGTEPQEAGVVGRFLIPIIYPGGDIREIQYILGTLVVVVNACIYGWIWYRRRTNRHKRDTGN